MALNLKKKSKRPATAEGRLGGSGIAGSLSFFAKPTTFSDSGSNTSSRTPQPSLLRTLDQSVLEQAQGTMDAAVDTSMRVSRMVGRIPRTRSNSAFHSNSNQPPSDGTKPKPQNDSSKSSRYATFAPGGVAMASFYPLPTASELAAYSAMTGRRTGTSPEARRDVNDPANRPTRSPFRNTSIPARPRNPSAGSSSHDHTGQFGGPGSSNQSHGHGTTKSRYITPTISSASNSSTTDVTSIEDFGFKTTSTSSLGPKSFGDSRIYPKASPAPAIPATTKFPKTVEERRPYFVRKKGKPHHSRSKSHAPYPVSYEKAVLDHDVFDTDWSITLCQSLTHHVFDVPPAKVLDLGCGTGHWILEAAKVWKDSHFIGFDLVPIQPDLDVVEKLASQTAKESKSSHTPPLRRSRSSSLGTSSKYFSTEEPPPVPPLPWSVDQPKIPPTKPSYSGDPEALNLPNRVEWVLGNFLEQLPFLDGTFDFVRAKHVARGIPEHKWDHFFSEVARVLKPGGAFEMQESDLNFPGAGFISQISLSSNPHGPSSPVKGTTVADSRVTLASYDSGISMISATNSPEKLSIEKSSLSIGRATGSPVWRRPASTFISSGGPASYEGKGLSLTVSDLPDRDAHSPASTTASTSTLTRGFSPLPLSTPTPDDHAKTTKVIDSLTSSDPRDHSLLEYYYSALHESRFINLNPLSLIQNFLLLHLSNIKSHPPIILYAPEQRSLGDRALHNRGISNASADNLMRHGTSMPSNGIVDQNHLREMVAKSLRPIPSHLRNGASNPPSTRTSLEHPESHSTGGPTQPPLQYPPISHSYSLSQTTSDPSGSLCVESMVAVDTSRMAPRPRIGSISHESTNPDSSNELPNKHFALDVRHLGMCLSQSVMGVLGCAESMWEYILTQDPTANRATFLELVKRYETDMKDRVALAGSMEDRLHWKIKDTAKPSHQNDYEANLERHLAKEAHLRSDPAASSMQVSASTSASKTVGRIGRVWCAWKAK